MQNPYELDLTTYKEIDKILPKLLSKIDLSNINENPKNNKLQKLNFQSYINHKKRQINQY